MIVSLIDLNLKIAFSELIIGIKKRHVQSSIAIVGFAAIVLNHLLNQYLISNTPINSWIFQNIFIEQKFLRLFLFIISLFNIMRGFFGTQFKNMFKPPDFNVVFNSKSSQREIYISRFLSNLFFHILYGIIVFLIISPVFTSLGFNLLGKITLFLSFFTYFESNQLLSHISYNVRLTYNREKQVSRKIVIVLISSLCVSIQAVYFYYDIIFINNFYNLCSILLIFLLLLMTSFYLCRAYLDSIFINSDNSIFLNLEKFGRLKEKFPILAKDFITILREGGISLVIELLFGLFLFLYFSFNYNLLGYSLSNETINIMVIFYPFSFIITYHIVIPYINLLKNDISSYWLINLSKTSIKLYLKDKYLFLFISSTIFLLPLITLLNLTNLSNVTSLITIFNSFIIYNIIGLYLNSYSIIYLKISSENSFIINFLQLFSSLVFYIINIYFLQLTPSYLIILSIILFSIIITRYEKSHIYNFMQIISIIFMIVFTATLLFGFIIFIFGINWILNNQLLYPVYWLIFVGFSSLSLTYIIFKTVNQLIIKNFENTGIKD